jgi:hypothetical protein
MKVIDYSNTIMYKIVPNDLNLDLIYIGSTTNFRARKAMHKCHCKNPNSKKYNFKVYSMIRENGGWDNWSMIEIEKYSCADSNECRKRERELMEQFNCNLNTNKPYVSPEEMTAFQKMYQPIYRANHKNEKREYNAKYRLVNKEILKAKAQQKKLASLNLEN